MDGAGRRGGRARAPAQREPRRRGDRGPACCPTTGVGASAAPCGRPCVQRAGPAGRTRVGGEVSVDLAVAGPGVARSPPRSAPCEKHREDHLLAELPVAPAPRRRGVRRRHVARTLPRRAPRGLPRDAQPDERRRADRRARPRGRRCSTTRGWPRRRSGSAQAYDVRVAAARRRVDGAFGGYSLLFVPHGADHGWQDDTLVMPEHRGRRLGAALKAANYADLPADDRRRPHLDRPRQHRDAPHQHGHGLPRRGAHVRGGGRHRLGCAPRGGSSVGQSRGLIILGSWVRAPPALRSRATHPSPAIRYCSPCFSSRSVPCSVFVSPEVVT